MSSSTLTALAVGALLLVILAGILFYGFRRDPPGQRSWWSLMDRTPGGIRVVGFVVLTVLFWYGFATLIGWVGTNLPDALQIVSGSPPWVKVTWNGVALIGGIWVAALLMWPAPPDPDYTRVPAAQWMTDLTREMEERFNRVDHDIRQHEERVTVLETTLEEVTREMKGLSSRLGSLSTDRFTTLVERVEKLEANASSLPAPASEQQQPGGAAGGNGPSGQEGPQPQ